MSIEKVAVISTAHLTRITAERLAQSPESPGRYGGWTMRYGFGFPVTAILAHVQETTETPACLAVAAGWARAQGCTYLVFDRDGDEIDELPSWQW